MAEICLEVLDSSSLKSRVLRFQKTGEGLKTIMSDLSSEIYRYPRSKPGCREDDCGDFFLFFYPRISRMLERFEDQGKPFECYLNSVLHWQYNSFLRRKNQIAREWRLSSYPGLWPQLQSVELPAGEESLYKYIKIAESLGLESSGKIRRKADKKRFLILLLKHSKEIGCSEIKLGAALTGTVEHKLRLAVQELNERIAHKDERLRILRERRNRAFYKARLLEEEMDRVVDSGEWLVFHKRLQRLNKSMRRAQDKISRIPLYPSNRDIAEVWGIPKGSVDTLLFTLKARLISVGCRKEKEYA